MNSHRRPCLLGVLTTLLVFSSSVFAATYDWTSPSGSVTANQPFTAEVTVSGLTDVYSGKFEILDGNTVISTSTQNTVTTGMVGGGVNISGQCMAPSYGSDLYQIRVRLFNMQGQEIGSDTRSLTVVP